MTTKWSNLTSETNTEKVCFNVRPQIGCNLWLHGRT